MNSDSLPNLKNISQRMKILNAVVLTILVLGIFITAAGCLDTNTNTTKVYNITYNMPPGIVNNANPTTFVYDDLPITLKNVTFTGYNFSGWYTDAGYTRPVSSIDSVGDKVIWAKFDVNTSTVYNITYYMPADAVNDYSNPSTFRYSNLPITLKTATKPGYDFKGWFEDTGYTKPVSSIDSIGNKAVWAKFDVNTTKVYNINYIMPTGAVNNVGNPSTFRYGDLSIPLKNATMSGYNFSGWYADAGYTKPVYSIDSIGDKSVWAKFEVNNSIVYTITYNMPADAVNNANNPSTFRYGNIPINMRDATLTGYDFKGWFEDAGYTKPVYSINSIGNKVVWAKFEVKKPEATATSTNIRGSVEGLHYYTYVDVSVHNYGGPGTVVVWCEVSQDGKKWTKSQSMYLSARESKDVKFTFIEPSYWGSTTYSRVWVENVR